MSKELIIGTGPNDRWRLPSSYDTEALRVDLEEAFSRGTFAWIAVELENGSLGELILNGRVVPFAAIATTPSVDR
jgi:hypothetical protein